MAQTIAIERVDHIGIRVRDFDRALAFYRVLGFTLVHRAVGDDVAIVRNEHGVELNLIFNANAGDPNSNVLIGRAGQISRLHTCRAARYVDPGNHRRFDGERYRDHTGAGQLWPKRASFSVPPRPRSQRD
jgi:catechol 2,3-dioxygenase-like lactoylglutathione lyase family enzyme